MKADLATLLAYKQAWERYTEMRAESAALAPNVADSVMAHIEWASHLEQQPKPKDDEVFMEAFGVKWYRNTQFPDDFVVFS
jgi:hypothetical protein